MQGQNSNTHRVLPQALLATNTEIGDLDQAASPGSPPPPAPTLGKVISPRARSPVESQVLKCPRPPHARFLINSVELAWGNANNRTGSSNNELIDRDGNQRAGVAKRDQQIPCPSLLDIPGWMARLVAHRATAAAANAAAAAQLHGGHWL